GLGRFALGRLALRRGGGSRRGLWRFRRGRRLGGFGDRRGRGGGRWLGGLFRGFCRRGGSAGRVEVGDHFADFGRFAGLLQDLRDDARARRGDVERRLLGLELDEVLVDGHGRAFAFVPLADENFGDR